MAPYVLLELFYRGKAPLAIVNTDIDQQSAPACSLEGIPYAFSFDEDIIGGISCYKPVRNDLLIRDATCAAGVRAHNAAAMR